MPSVNTLPLHLLTKRLRLRITLNDRISDIENSLAPEKAGDEMSCFRRTSLLRHNQMNPANCIG